MESIYVDYYERLDSWFEMFKENKELRISEAKELAEKIKSSSSDVEKEGLQEELLMGTIHEVYKFIKDNGLISLCDTGYVELEDLISSLTLAWAENLDEKLLEVGRYSTLFSREYFESVAEKLGVEDLSDSLKIRGSGYLGALASYYRDKDNGVEVSPYFDYTFATGITCTEEQKKKTVDIIEKGYQRYKDSCFINSDNTALLGFYGMIFTSIVVKEGRYECDSDLDFTDGVIEAIDVKNIILNCPDINEQQREVLIQRFGFDGLGDKELEVIGENIGLGKCRVSQIAAKGLRNLRGNSKVRRYNIS